MSTALDPTTPEVPEAPDASERSSALIGLVAWIALFAFLAAQSPWMVVFAVGLAASILLHELGHFWTARRSGMKATQFFLGFGPRIWSIHRNGVEYGVRSIPLGGFVKIIGMSNVDEVDPGDEAFTYRQGSFPRRMWVITAGSVMHLIVAFAIIVPVYAFVGRFQQTDTVQLAAIVEDSPAEAAGLLLGDVIESVDGVAMTSAEQLRSVLAASTPGTTLTFGVVRNGEPSTLSVTLVQHPDFDTTRGYLGIRPSSEGRVALGVGEALVRGPQDLVVGVGQAVQGVARVINPINVWGHLTGTNDDVTSRPGTIIGATQISEDVGEFDGWAGVLSLLAAVNVSVGVFNMFPLLPLDGGHAAIAIYERVRSRRGRRYFADASKLTPVAVVCIALLAFMFLTGLYLDTVKG